MPDIVALSLFDVRPVCSVTDALDIRERNAVSFSKDSAAVATCPYLSNLLFGKFRLRLLLSLLRDYQSVFKGMDKVAGFRDPFKVAGAVVPRVAINMITFVHGWWRAMEGHAHKVSYFGAIMFVIEHQCYLRPKPWATVSYSRLRLAGLPCSARTPRNMILSSPYLAEIGCFIPTFVSGYWYRVPLYFHGVIIPQGAP